MAPIHILSENDCQGAEPGDFLTRLFKEGGPGTRVFLRPKTVWSLQNTVFLTADDTELATLDYPDNDDDKAILQTHGKGAMAINMGGLKRSRLRNLIVDGMEPMYGRAEPGAALVFMAGGGSEDQLLENCVLRHGRGWSCCHVFDGGLRPRVIANKVGPSGHSAPKGPWADGLSVACIDGIIANNTIVDATDGAIVIFCAPGTLVVNNTIIAKTRIALGGINMVDRNPNTRVLSNRIYSDGSFIKLGIGIGSRPWGNGTGIGAYGGQVLDNTFGPGEIGYAIAIGGARDMMVQGNHVHPRTVFEGQAVHNNPAAQPFVKFTSAEEPGGNLQSDFVEGYFRFLIGIERGTAAAKTFYSAGFHLSPGPGIKLRSARLELLNEGVLVLWDERVPGRVLWSSGSSAIKASGDPFALLTEEGSLEIRDTARKLLWTSSRGTPPTPYPGQRELGAAITISETPSYLSIKNPFGDTVFASPPVHFPTDWTLDSGMFVSLSSSGPAWLVLEPDTSALVLHCSAQPLTIEEKSVVWRSRCNAHVKWNGAPDCRSRAVLQGDSNLVIYAHERGAIWASGTQFIGEKLPYVALYGPDEPGGMRLDLLNGDLKPRWSSTNKS